jgi:uncharacterized protein YecT (DUF1311 family)
MRLALTALIRNAAAASLLWAALPHGAFATSTEPVTDPQIDPAPCVAAAATNDADNIIAICGALADNNKTLKADRIKALIARAGAFTRRNMLDRAIDDDSIVLRLDPDHPLAKAGYKSLALELERLGALLAVNNRPSFNCATAKAVVEKAVCANPELASLDRQINAVNSRVVSDASRRDPRAGRALQREQDDFLARRNAGFGRSDYDLQKAMRERLDHLLAIGH